MMNMHCDLEHHAETEEIQLRDILNFEQLLWQDSAANGAIWESANFVFSTSQLRALLVEDKIAGIEILIAQYHNLFYRIAYDILYSYDLAQDAVNEAYIKIYRWLKESDASDIQKLDLLPYLCRIVHNASHTYLYNEKRQRLRKNRQKEALLIDQRRRFETPDEVLEREEEKRIIHEEINQLPVKYRRVIHLRYFLDEEDNASEIESERYKKLAALTGVSEETLRTHVRRAKHRLKKQLHKRGIDH